MRRVTIIVHNLFLSVNIELCQPSFYLRITHLLSSSLSALGEGWTYISLKMRRQISIRRPIAHGKRSGHCYRHEFNLSQIPGIPNCNPALVTVTVTDRMDREEAISCPIDVADCYT
jgi:hypothetical protein